MESKRIELYSIITNYLDGPKKRGEIKPGTQQETKALDVHSVQSLVNNYFFIDHFVY